MNDQTNRRKLIDKLKHWHLTNTEHGVTWLPEHFVAEAIEALSQPSADQWIPCSERLPENDGYYETTIDILGCRLNKPICFDTVENRWLANHCVIAWRERLEPYKGVE